MTIRYANGKTVEAILLRQTEDGIRVAVPGSVDVLQFSQVNQAWVSEDCEPVQIQFGPKGRDDAEETYIEENFICSKELAARLLHMLWTDSNQDVWPVEQTAQVAGVESTPRLMLN